MQKRRNKANQEEKSSFHVYVDRASVATIQGSGGTMHTSFGLTSTNCFTPQVCCAEGRWKLGP